MFNLEEEKIVFLSKLCFRCLKWQWVNKLVTDQSCHFHFHVHGLILRCRVRLGWWKLCIRLSPALQNDPDRSKVLVRVPGQRHQHWHHLLLNGQGHNNRFGEANPQQVPLRGGSEKYETKSKTSSGWRINGTLAGSWGSSSISALSEKPPVRYPKIQGNRCSQPANCIDTAIVF